jgi:3-hydroxyisobutyryl-CoA hydrolase
MYNDMHSLLESNWDSWILQRGVPRAYSAGADLMEHLDDENLTVPYMTREYNYTIKTSQHGKNISLWEGFVMGAGVGTSVFNRFRVATDTTVFAMPECAIGIVTDAGANKFLPGIKTPGVGRYIALTGARVKGADLYHYGLATHYVPSD